MKKPIQIGGIVATLNYKLHPYRRGGNISYSKNKKDLKPCRRSVTQVELYLEASENFYKKVILQPSDLKALLKEIEDLENVVTKEIVEPDEY